MNQIHRANGTIYSEYIEQQRQQEGVALPPPMHRHRGIDDERICMVIGCNFMTTTVCGICTGCHPIQRVEGFPCNFNIN